MNRNQKIAIGCGAGGCLGLIFVAIVGVIVYFAMQSATGNYNRTTTVNVNRDSSTSLEDANTSSSSEDPESNSLSDDDKHKLFQAAAITQDTLLMQRVWRKLGLMGADGAPNDQYTQFLKNHVAWLFNNADFVQTVNTPEKAREYVEAHIND